MSCVTHIRYHDMQYLTYPSFNTLRPKQNARHFPHVQMYFPEWKCINFDLDFTEVCAYGSNQQYSSIGLTAWCRPGDKPLYEPMMISILTHMCVTWTHWVNIKALLNSIWCQNGLKRAPMHHTLWSNVTFFQSELVNWTNIWVIKHSIYSYCHRLCHHRRPVCFIGLGNRLAADDIKQIFIEINCRDIWYPPLISNCINQTPLYSTPKDKSLNLKIARLCT